jgi:hypothetical protein
MSEVKQEENEENTPVCKEAVILSLAKDLVELAIQAQKVLGGSAVPFALIEEAKLLALMTNSVIDQYTDANKEKSDEA